MSPSNGSRSRTRSWHRSHLEPRQNEKALMELDGRVALVTGAGTRVGRVIALALGRAGMRVGVHYSGSEKGARQTVEEIIAAGAEARTPPGGLTDSAPRPRFVD